MWSPSAGLRRGEGERAVADVRVGSFSIRIRVVAVVLVEPPAERQPDEQVAVQEPDQVVGLAAAKDLPVPGVVAEKRDLGERDGQEGGDQQLVPGAPEQAETHPTGGEQAYGDRDLRGVVARSALQQARLLDLPGQL